MKLEWIEEFADHYLQTPSGKGVFLAGIVLGMVARAQDKDLSSAPMFKQIMFGKMQRRDLLRHLGRLPELLRAYDVKYTFYIQQLAGRCGELLLTGGSEMGVEGNFAFSVAFLNSNDYFWRIFAKEESDGNEGGE